jgi:hypothetical protein
MVTAADLPELLLERLPELGPAVAQEASFWRAQGQASIGPDTIFGLVLAPFVVQRLETEHGSGDEVLQRVFCFLEELTGSTDDAVLSAIDVSFGEELLSHPAEFARAREYMGAGLRATFEFLESKRKLLSRR